MKTSTATIQSNDKLDGNMNICTPRQIDILCGKDKACLNHEGSRCFRMIIDLYRQDYEKCSTKLEKMEITRQIFENIQKLGGRFLRYNSKTKSWWEINPTAVRDKIGHALRFANQQQQRRQLQSKTQIKRQNSQRLSLPSHYEQLSLDSMSPVNDTKTETNFKSPMVTPVPSPSPAPLPSLETDKFSEAEVQQNSQMNYDFYDPLPLSTQEYDEWKGLLEPDPLLSNSIDYETKHQQNDNLANSLLDNSLTKMITTIECQQGMTMESSISYPALSIEQNTHRQQKKIIASDYSLFRADEHSELSLRGWLRHCRFVPDLLPMSTLNYTQWQQKELIAPNLGTKLERAPSPHTLDTEPSRIFRSA